ncbi:MAG: phosphohistidine phosphatase SixA [Bacteroidetes bacterium]|nr:phosphohistidine phosphatase SixA [Bacteroidota bacterium]
MTDGMHIYLVRHTEAVPVGGTITRDADRTLSVRGEADAVLMGQALAKVEPDLDIVVTSPLVRAVQTGEIIGGQISQHPILHVSEHLAPGFNHRSLMQELVSLSGGGRIIAVGHQPDLTNFISYFIAGSSYASIAMETGAIASIALRPEGGRSEAYLRWILTPDIVKSLQNER